MHESDWEKITVFFAWQSDVLKKENRYAIRNALTKACSNLSLKYGVEFILDEATREMPGAGNIPAEIQKKIIAADIFVGDVTTINNDAPIGKRRVPNPNVTFEVGFAQAYLGWNRIILLFNTAAGKLSDLPFDFDRQRVSQFKFTTDKGKAAQHSQFLEDLCLTALETIFNKKPIKEYDNRNLSPEEIKRKRDIAHLERALARIHWPSLTEKMQMGPKYITGKDIFYFEEFDSVVSSPVFHLYDTKTLSIIKSLRNAWRKTISSSHYHDVSGQGIKYTFHMPGDFFKDEEQSKAWNLIEKELTKLDKAVNSLMPIIRNEYIEIDITETNRRAHESYAKHLTEIEKESEIFKNSISKTKNVKALAKK